MEKWSIGKSALITDLGMCINHYRLNTVGLYACINVGVKIGDRLLYPGMIVMINAGRRKQCNPDYENNYFVGPPDFVLDVYEDPKKILERKLLFSSAGVGEYLVVNEQLSEIGWYRLKNGEFEEIKPDSDGIIKSSSLPGLWMSIPALQKRDFWSIKACIDHGLTRRSHHDLMQSIWNKN